MNSGPSFLSASILAHPKSEVIQRILSAAIQAVEPGNAIANFVQRRGALLTVDDVDYDLDAYRHVYVLAIGKASQAMTKALVRILGDYLTCGWVIPKHAYHETDPRLTVQPGGHPLPDENSLAAGNLLVQASQSFSVEDLVFCLVSGGGSALVTAPYPGITLQDMQDLTRELLACGARIDEINTLRRHLDQVKGGGLAKLAAPAQIVSLILSDVVGSPLEAIASGPTVADPSSVQDALDVIDRYHLGGSIPAVIQHHLIAGSETPKPGDKLFERVQNVLVGSNELAARAAARQAYLDGIEPVLLGSEWQGEARFVAVQIIAELTENTNSPVCLIAGGETTVTLHGKGKGGRNQELALAAVPVLNGKKDVLLVTLATDGEDGPTDAAGAVVTGETMARGLVLGLDVYEYLSENDAYHYFEALGDLIKPGPTGTNVNDLTFLFKH
ncbi:MAG: glycerate kinase [Chloroflexi bacterium HGW-Chloroflexi-10]|nr:MAG: glycerate kinase [Chloroflexi bacterium HGW-Chloroflexi-10]